MIPEPAAPTLQDYYPLLRHQLDPTARERLDRLRASDLPALVGETLAALYHPEKGPTGD